MPYPPTTPPNTRTNATPQADNHPGDHNQISTALTEILNHVAVMEATFNPLGVVQLFCGDVAPLNWMFCRGDPISRTVYAGLFGVVGTRFGVGDNSTTFNLPDFRGRYPIGYNVGDTWFSGGVGEKFGTKDASVPVHAHGVNILSGNDDADHSHHVQISTGLANTPHEHSMRGVEGPPGPPQAAFGSGRIAGWQLDSYGYMANTSPAGADHVHGVIGDTGGRSGFHRHPINGSSDNAGVDGTNTNLPPSLSMNLIIRVL